MVKNTETQRKVWRDTAKTYRDNPKNKDRVRDWRVKDRTTHIRQILLRQARNRATKIGIAFDLDIDDIIIPDVCPILGIPVFVSVGQGSHRKNPGNPSLDRRDNTKGYIKGNVWVISWRANNLKRDATNEELIKIGKWAELNEEYYESAKKTIYKNSL